MKALLDTHVLLWLAISPELVPDGVRDLLEAADRRVISAASAYEISYKARLGRLPRGQEILDAWERLLRDMIADDLPATSRHLARAGALDWPHRDPFDRILVAQAQLEGLTLITKDAAIRDCGQVSVAPWR